MKKGFTLIELIVVIIIVGILASVGLAQYTKVVEKGRWGEARTILGSLRTQGIAYQVENSASAPNVGTLDNTLPTSCLAGGSYFFSYAYSGSAGTATRCAANGKLPAGTTESGGKTKILSEAGVWSGTGTALGY
ncbi:MAG: prepilin-type N-terminal cleavage/methylation domain-containing protein [Candidatus Omnitrophica bacterium]|nr:prepilin-type N-terminal cleavage/methylation domain-containing protein [Candidatus Omnitrophota bacterium]